MKDGESPLDRFKRATSSTMRAMARRDDLYVSFSSNAQGLSGSEMRLPTPSRDLTQQDASLVRGEADAQALRLRYHDNKVHNANRPQNQAAREIFDAVEQARCEAIGSRAMAGVSANLDAAMNERYRARGYTEIEHREDVPLSEVMRVMAREAMTGQAPPPAAKAMVAPAPQMTTRVAVPSKAASRASQ